MLNFVLLQALLGALLLKLRRLLTPPNMFYFLAGSLTGSMASLMIMGSLAVGHPLNSDPGPDKINLMRQIVFALAIGFGLLTGMLGVRLQSNSRPSNSDQGLGISPENRGTGREY